MKDNNPFLTTQIITYIGNKRKLLDHIEAQVEDIKTELSADRMVCADLFSGSGIVSRMLKRHSSTLIVNDLEPYSTVLSQCYLCNRKDFNRGEYLEARKRILDGAERGLIRGIVSKNYAPCDDNDIKLGERVFYTSKNAMLIDTYRSLIDTEIFDQDMRKFFLAPLITEASVHVNTSGVFKGFHKDKHTGIGCFGGTGRNALHRILGSIELMEPVFSDFDSDLQVHQRDAVELAVELDGIDLAYLDPPYNQHPYGSNYFMLNLILKNRIDSNVSRVSGIPDDWNRSAFNSPKQVLPSLEAIVSEIRSKYVILSYNSEGFIDFHSMKSMLEKYGNLKIVEIPYNTFRGSRNLRGRSIYVSEYLFVLRKIGATV